MADDAVLKEFRGLKLTASLCEKLRSAVPTDGGALRTDAYGAALGALRRRGLVTRHGSLLTAKGVGARRVILEDPAHG